MQKRSILHIFITCFIMSASVAALPQSLQAQDGLSDVCEAETRNGNGWDNAALRPMIEGPWTMSATGTNYTQGTNVDSVNVRYDVASRGFVMENLKLKPLASLPSDSPLRKVNILDTLIDVTVNENGGGISVADVALLQGCADTTQLPIYWWSQTGGGGSAWGMMLFMSSEMAVGHMMNSAGGSRTTVLVR